jgi:hypothetical protein
VKENTLRPRLTYLLVAAIASAATLGLTAITTNASNERSRNFTSRPGDYLWFNNLDLRCTHFARDPDVRGPIVRCMRTSKLDSRSLMIGRYRIWVSDRDGRRWIRSYPRTP